MDMMEFRDRFRITNTSKSCIHNSKSMKWEMAFVMSDVGLQW